MQIRQYYPVLEKSAARSNQDSKITIASMMELTNRLGSMDVTKPSVCIRPSAIDGALGRHSKTMCLNKSSLVYSKGNSTTESSKNDVSSSKKQKKKKVECRTCRGIFNMDVYVYTGH